jgi:hypothetical protein
MEQEFIIKNRSKCKVVILTGGDSKTNLIQQDPTIYFANTHDHLLSFAGIKSERCMNIRIPSKRFDMFKPCPLGDKIYAYVGNGDGKKFRIDLIEVIGNSFGREIMLIGLNGQPIEKMITDYYTPACLNLQLNPDAGFTSSCEMAAMGRPTIGNTGAPWAIPYDNEVELFMNIAGFLNDRHTFNPVNLMPDDYFMNSDVWLNTEFYAG